MFHIEVALKSTGENGDEITGIVALDLRRRLGLPDDSILENESPISRWVEVDEPFARLHFSPTSRRERRWVRLDQVVSGDLGLERNGCGLSFSGESLTDERVKALFVAGSKSE